MGYTYINPSVVASTMELLTKYKETHPNSKTPMADACNDEPVNGTYTKARYARAAQRLGWDVVRSCGHVYENGVLVW